MCGLPDGIIGRQFSCFSTRQSKITGLSLLPIQMVSLTGVIVALSGIAFAAFLMVRRFIVGPESEGVFTLFAILFAFVGMLLLAVGLVGEYVGRIYAEVRRRPVYRIREVVAQSMTPPQETR